MIVVAVGLIVVVLIVVVMILLLFVVVDGLTVVGFLVGFFVDFVAFVVVFLVAFVVIGLTVVVTFSVLDCVLPDSVVKGFTVVVASADTLFDVNVTGFDIVDETDISVDFSMLLSKVRLSTLGLTVVYLISVIEFLLIFFLFLFKT